jgi:regulator of nonsense transcripts 2
MMRRFIEHIIYSLLTPKTFDQCLRLLRRLDWTNADHRDWALTALASPHRVKYANVPCLAALVAAVIWYHDWVCVRVVDAVMDNIRLGMEVGTVHAKYNQQRLTDARYVGELYNYKVINSAQVFATLYTYIGYGVVDGVFAVSASAAHCKHMCRTYATHSTRLQT